MSLFQVSINMHGTSTLKAVYHAIDMTERGNGIVTHIGLCDKSMQALLEEAGMNESELRINGLPVKRDHEDILYVKVPDGQPLDASAWAGAIPKMEEPGKVAAEAGRTLRELIHRRN